MEKVQAIQENNNLLKIKRKKKSKSGYKPIWIIISFAILLIILLLPTPAGLPIMAKGALAILAFAVIMWVTEAVTYPVSATMILGLIILICGFSPVQQLSEKLGNPKEEIKYYLAQIG